MEKKHIIILAISIAGLTIPLTLFASTLSIPVGDGFGLYDTDGNLLRDQQEIYELLAKKKINPVIHSVLPLEKVRQAHKLLEDGKVKGKIVLDCR